MNARRRSRRRYSPPAESPRAAPEPAIPAAPPAAVAPAPEPSEAGAAPAAQPRRHRLRGTLLWLALCAFAFVTGLLVFNGIVMPRLIHGGGSFAVPDVQNLTLDQAEQALRPVNLQVSRAGERFDPSVPRGFILSQDPAPGSSVRGGRRVYVVVSLGEEFSSVPELFGESQRSAEQLLRSAGLRLGGITRAPSDEVGAGLVAASDPGPESVLPHGGEVHLLLSTGAGEESLVMPDLQGREIATMRRQLEAYGFRVVVPPGTALVGAIVAQRPPPGARITRATEILLQPTGRLIR